jgi:hypothetical protein
MQRKQKVEICLAAVCSILAVISSQQGNAFQIKGTVQSMSERTTLFDSITNNIIGTSTITTKEISEIKRGGTDEFLSLLRGTYGNWTFSEGKNLEGAFNVLNYYPCKADTRCGSELSVFPELRSFAGRQGGLGATMIINYEPDTEDRLNINKIRWIQRAKVDTGGQEISVYDIQGTSFDLIDTESNRSPFYQSAGYVGMFNPETGLPSYTFFDIPYTPSRLSDLYNHDWNFELYLVERTAPNTVTIHNGISWGWENIFTRTQASAPTDPPPSCDSGGGGGSGGGSGGGGCSDNNGWGDERDDRELPLFEEDEFDEDDFYVVTDDTQDIDLEIISNLLCQSQDYAILPSETDEDWKVFNDIPSTCWFDPETTYGFKFQALENTRFTDLLDFPVGIDADERFTVQVGEEILGEFSPGESVDFVSLLGEGIAEFKILDIDIQEELTDVPFKLGFNEALATFQMRGIAEHEEIPTRIPEPASVAGILTIGLLGIGGKLTQRK